MRRTPPQFVGLDPGSSTVTAAVGLLRGDGDVDIIGLGVVAADGIRRGAITDVNAAAESIRAAIEEAELTAGTDVGSAYVSLSGGHVEGTNTLGAVSVTDRHEGITRTDIGRAVAAARAIRLPTGREVLGAFPQGFTVDDEAGIRDPVGMTGSRLQANVHVVTGSTTAIRHVVHAVNRAGVTVTELVPAPVAAAEAVLTAEEKEAGVVLADIGASATQVAIYEQGVLWHTGVVPIGGTHFTGDVAVELRTPAAAAEILKRRLGAALAALVDETEDMDVPSVGRCPTRMLPRRFLARILQARTETLFGQIRAQIAQVGLDLRLAAGIVLTGGGATLAGVEQAAEQMLAMLARTGHPALGGGFADPATNPACATAAGLVMWAARQRATVPPAAPKGMIARVARRIEGVLDGLL